MSKINDPPPFFGSKIMNLLVFFDFEPKKCFRVRLHGVCTGPGAMSACAVLRIFQPFLLCLGDAFCSL